MVDVIVLYPMVDPQMVANLGAIACQKKDLTEEDINALGQIPDEEMKPLMHAINAGHFSVLEHANLTFYISGISRVTLDQLTRHRIASYSVFSQRWSDISDTKTYIPKSVLETDPELADAVKKHIMQSHDIYKALLDAGVPKEDARYIAPEGTGTSLLLTMNCRELLHFFELRCCNRAQWEIRELADKMLYMCKQIAPRIFANAGPACVTKGICPEVKPCGAPRKEDEWDLKTDQEVPSTSE